MTNIEAAKYLEIDRLKSLICCVVNYLSFRWSSLPARFCISSSQCNHQYYSAYESDTAVPAVIRHRSGVHRIFVGEKHSRPYPIDISEILNANASPSMRVSEIGMLRGAINKPIY